METYPPNCEKHVVLHARQRFSISHLRAQRYKTGHGRVKQPFGPLIAPDPCAVNPAPIATTTAAAAAAAAAYADSDAASPAPVAAAVAVAASAAVAVATSAASAASAAASVATSAASAASAAVAAAADKLNSGPGCRNVFLIEHIERRQANVGDFLLTESDFVAVARVARRQIRCQATGYRGCAAC
jgi:hypothetical protein